MAYYKHTRSDFGITWYKVKEKNSGINDYLESLRANDDNLFLVKRHHYAIGQFWGIANIQQLKKMLKTNTYLYEILSPNRKKKVYFDVDSKTDTLVECKNKILESFPNANFQISGYRNADKCSFHIILSNYTFDSSTVNVIKNFVDNNRNIGFDSAVYNKFNLMKCINQSKPKKDAQIQQYIEGDTDLTKHLILCNFDEICFEVKQLPNLIRNTIKRSIEYNASYKIDLLDINKNDIKHNLADDFDINNSYAETKLKAIPLYDKLNENTLKHDVIWKIMIWCKNENLSFNVFWDWCKQKDASQSRMNRYLDYWESAEKYMISEKFINTILYKFYPFLEENRTKRMYRTMNTIQPTHYIASKWLSKADINNDVKISYLSIKMGGNKTGSVIDYINEYYKDLRVLFISPRIALSNDIMGRMKESHLEFANYKDIKNKSDLQYFTKLICSINSIHYLADAVNYDLVIVDEIETIWPSFKGEARTHGKNVNANWNTFMNILTNSKKVIVMDALMSRKTLQVIGQPKDNYEIITLEEEQESRDYIKYRPREEDLWFNKIRTSLVNGEKIIIFMPYKMVNTNSKRHHLAGVNELVKWLCNELNLTENEDIIGYYAEAKENKEALTKIQEIWGRAKCIVANTCIAVGNNYSGDDFDKIFAYFSNWVETRDFIQFLYRVRNPKEKTMHIYYEKQITTFDNFCRHKIVLEDTGFNKLKSGFIIEDKTSPKDKLDVLMKKCNINLQNTNPEKIPNIKLSNEFVIKYSDILDIDENTYKLLTSNIEMGFGSLMERLQFDKYKQKKKFVDITPKGILEIMWEYGEEIINKLADLTDSNNIINRLFDELSYSSFYDFIENYTDEQISTLKVPKTITNDMIKMNFNLKNEITNRGVELVARIINGYFNKRVMYANRIGKIYQRITLKNEKRIILYEFDDLFKELIECYKQYSCKFNRYNKEAVCLIED